MDIKSKIMGSSRGRDHIARYDLSKHAPLYAYSNSVERCSGRFTPKIIPQLTRLGLETIQSRFSIQYAGEDQDTI